MDIGSVSSYINMYQAGQMERSADKPSLEDMINRLIQDKDEDGSGGLSIDELSISEEAFAQADADGNGQLDSEELIANAEMIGKELGLPPKFEETGVDLIA